MASILKIPPPSASVIDVKTGLADVYWYDFWAGLAATVTNLESRVAALEALFSEGTWTPALTFDTPGSLSVTYSAQDAVWLRIGRWILADFFLQTSSITMGTASGNAQITGLPFAASDVRWYAAAFWSGITKAGYTALSWQLSSGENVFRPRMFGSGVGFSGVAVADIPANVLFQGSLVYPTD